MKTRKKLLIALSAAAAVTGLVVSDVTASATAEPQNFVLISFKDAAGGITITQYDSSNTVIGVAHPHSRSWYWYVNAQAAYVTVQEDSRKYRIPGQGTLNQATNLPVCFRVTKSDKLHQVTNEPCDTNGAQEGTWS